MDNNKKKLVITGTMVLRAITVIIVIAAVIYVIVSIAGGTPILDVITENPFIGGGLLVLVIVSFILPIAKTNSM